MRFVLGSPYGWNCPPGVPRTSGRMRRDASTDEGMRERICRSPWGGGPPSGLLGDTGRGTGHGGTPLVSHGPDLRLEFGVRLQPEIPAALGTFPRPGFILLPHQNDDPAHSFPGDAMEGDCDELVVRGHAGPLRDRHPRFTALLAHPGSIASSKSMPLPGHARQEGDSDGKRALGTEATDSP